MTRVGSVPTVALRDTASEAGALALLAAPHTFPLCIPLLPLHHHPLPSHTDAAGFVNASSRNDTDTLCSTNPMRGRGGGE